MATPEQQKAHVQGATSEQVTPATSTEAPIDAANAAPNASPLPLSIEYWEGPDGLPDVMLWGIKGAHTPGDLFRSVAAVDPDLVRMLAAARKGQGPWLSAANAIVAVEAKPASPTGPVLQPEPKPAQGFEGLSTAEELKRFFDLVGIEASGIFVVSTCYEHKSKETGKWIESWSHYCAQRYGDGGNADLYDYLRYGGHKPSDKGKNKLLNRFRQKDSDTFRSTQYYIRTAEFAKDPVDGMVRSFDKGNLLRRRTYSTESDEGTLAQQVERIAYLKGKGLIPSAEVYSGGKSIHLHFVRPRGWKTTAEQDAYIDMGLCVLYRGDAGAVEPNNAFRLPGCDRPGGRHQRLLDGRAEPYGSYEELRSLIEVLLAEEGITDQEALEVAYVKRKSKSDQKRVRTAVERSRNSELGREWDSWEGWTESERKAAGAFHQVLSDEQLLDFIPGSAAQLVRKGSLEGCRNDDGLSLTRHLRGAVEKLDDLGLDVEEAAQQVLDRFVEASEAVGGPVDVERLHAQYEGAEGAMPGRPVAAFLHQLWYHTQGHLGKEKTGNTPSLGESADWTYGKDKPFSSTRPPGSKWGKRGLSITKSEACLEKVITNQVKIERNLMRRLRRVRRARKALCLLDIKEKELLEMLAEEMDRKTGNAYQAYDAAARAEMEIPPVEWVIQGLIPARDLSLIGGMPKVGKTRLCTHIIRAALLGESFLGFPAPKIRRKVLLISDDQGDADTKEMLENVDLYGNDGLIWSPRFRVTEDNLDKLLSDIASNPGICVVIDSLRSVTRGKSFGENDQEMGMLLYDLKTAVIDAGGSLIIVHHCNKNHHSVGLEALSGHNSIGGAANTIITMQYIIDGTGKPMKQEPQRRLHREPRSGEPFDLVIRPSVDGATWERVMDHDQWLERMALQEQNDGDDDFSSGLPKKVVKRMEKVSYEHRELLRLLIEAEEPVKFSVLLKSAGIIKSPAAEKKASRFLDGLTGAVESRNLSEKGAPKAYWIPEEIKPEVSLHTYTA
jgi:hypothetical protein